MTKVVDSGVRGSAANTLCRSETIEFRAPIIKAWGDKPGAINTSAAAEVRSTTSHNRPLLWGYYWAPSATHPALRESGLAPISSHIRAMAVTTLSK